MTDRKLLEEIERQYLGREGDYVDWTLTLSAQTFNKVIQFAKEQAKRVQELEKDIKEWEIVNECWEEINENLAEQNKRYRKVINNINEKAALYGVNEQVYEAIKEAIKAVEVNNESK